ncbi:nuclear transport factor 2 family protein [Ascidiimonas sp. W6]|uniref:nuclear transport factor 2 family protein n=1 Tax=Ascidiimonas meishanensis TaxID=3128903 RepID=UPI0030EDB4D7
MRYKYLITIFLILITSVNILAQKTEKEVINEVLDAWHLAASNASFNAYFDLMTEDAVFIGTDATENWQNDDFKTFAKPYFDNGKAWSFTPIERNIYLEETANFAWFDELLDTQMKICRGSGVLKKVYGKWKITHYVLSITIPNDNVDKVVKDKADFDHKLIDERKKKY